MMAFSVTDVQKGLKGADYPASAEELADLAAGNGASDDLVESLRSKDGQEFDGPDDVMKAMKGELGGE
jgi:hypothetical protein